MGRTAKKVNKESKRNSAVCTKSRGTCIISVSDHQPNSNRNTRGAVELCVLLFVLEKQTETSKLWFCDGNGKYPGTDWGCDEFFSIPVHFLGRLKIVLIDHGAGQLL